MSLTAVYAVLTNESIDPSCVSAIIQCYTTDSLFELDCTVDLESKIALVFRVTTIVLITQMSECAGVSDKLLEGSKYGLTPLGTPIATSKRSVCRLVSGTPTAPESRETQSRTRISSAGTPGESMRNSRGCSPAWWGALHRPKNLGWVGALTRR